MRFRFCCGDWNLDWSACKSCSACGGSAGFGAFGFGTARFLKAGGFWPASTDSPLSGSKEHERTRGFTSHPRRTETTKSVRETEAEAVAFV
jgi:hypothetical protein